MVGNTALGGPNNLPSRLAEIKASFDVLPDDDHIKLLSKKYIALVITALETDPIDEIRELLWTRVAQNDDIKVTNVIAVGIAPIVFDPREASDRWPPEPSKDSGYSRIFPGLRSRPTPSHTILEIPDPGMSRLAVLHCFLDVFYSTLIPVPASSLSGTSSRTTADSQQAPRSRYPKSSFKSQHSR